jgi:prepilin-type N-terminal cleavage/methylation domain-containing protein
MSFRPSWSLQRDDRLSGRDGFTLIEVLVAFSVMGLLISVLFRGVVAIRMGSNAFDERIHAVFVARTVLDDALAHRDAKAGTLSGVRDGNRWTVVATSLDLSAQLPSPTPKVSAPPTSPPLGATGFDQAPAKPLEAWAPQRLVIRVATTGRPVELETIRLVKVE